MSAAAFRRQVVALVRTWQPRLLLDTWALTVQVTRRMDAAADCEARPEYLEALLRFNPALIRPEDLEAVVVHELLHCHTWALWEVAEDGDRVRAEREHERLTSTLQRVVMR